jgi:predicted DNA-binding antitoxin AbrB/MazE fold protein
MTQNIQAIYENGILRPLAPLDLAEGSIVEIEIIRILGDSAEFIKNIEKDLAELEESKHNRL